jgi:formylglycine-generating enzyme required for sulfatase activity
MTLLDNRYQVTRELGEGAFGKTYIAVDTRSPMKRQCVVKQLKLVATPEQNRFYQGLFEREAEVLEQIGQKANGRIPNLLAYFTEGGDHFFVMELVSGPTLADSIAKVGRQDEATVRGWLMRILETLDFIHGVEYTDTQGKKFRGVIHRDIKPGNIIVRESDGAPVLIDFGVVKEIAARSTVRNDGTMTMTAGTPFFMPPEQEKGQPVVASDLYALGVTAMVALTGKQPIELYDLTDLSFEWRKFAPEISTELADVLDRATQTKAKDRFQSAREILDALSPRPPVTVPPIPPSSPTPLPPTLPPPAPPSVSGVISRLEEERQGRKSASLKNPFLFVGVALLLVVFGGGGLATWYAVTNSNKSEKVSPTATPAPKDESKPPPTAGKIGDSLKLPSGIEVMYIPAGEFLMGSPENEAERSFVEGPVHKVVITEPFWMGKYEVTQAQWESVMGTNPSIFKNCPQCPVEEVSWDDCQEFIKKLNARNDGNVYALPTEAQWEYACRAGTTTPFAFGATITPNQVNYDGNYPYGNGAKGLYRKKTIPVGSLNSPNAWGLHDMHGNVLEWCADWYDGNYYKTNPTNDPKGPGSGTSRVVRGGSWRGNAGGCRSACRRYGRPDGRSDYVGVRVVVFSARTN